MAEVIAEFRKLINQYHNGTGTPLREDFSQPDYFVQAIPYLLTFVVLEIVVMWIKHGSLRGGWSMADSLTSFSHGIYFLAHGMLTQGMFSYVYTKIYENYKIYELPWSSPFTWYVAAISVDFCYYWIHRACHEVNIFWAKHQVHHSSDYYNLTTALRLSAFQIWLAWPFYLPMAFFVPPSILLIHKQFNLLYQFWIHTELIDSLGPLEYVLNTPKHHRVHHGSNRYCIDKNFGGVLIIWDRMFNTFAEERDQEKIVYGLVEEVNSFNPFWLHFFHYTRIWTRVQNQKSPSDKLSVLLKGPAWRRGKPRLGEIEDVPVVQNRPRFHVKLPTWKNLYVGSHYLCTFLGFHYLTINYLNLAQTSVIFSVAYVISTLTSLSLVLEDRKYIAALAEIARCGATLLFISFAKSSINTLLFHFIYNAFSLSIGIWVVYLHDVLRKDALLCTNKKT